MKMRDQLRWWPQTFSGGRSEGVGLRWASTITCSLLSHTLFFTSSLSHCRWCSSPLTTGRSSWRDRRQNEREMWGSVYLYLFGSGLHLHVQKVPGLLFRETGEPVVLWVILEGCISCSSLLPCSLL